jgi:hypothetical protein
MPIWIRRPVANRTPPRCRKLDPESRLCLTNSFVTRVARRGEGKASGHKSLEAYYQYVEDDLRTGNAAIADASPSAVAAICQTEPRLQGPKHLPGAALL